MVRVLITEETCELSQHINVEIHNLSMFINSLLTQVQCQSGFTRRKNKTKEFLWGLVSNSNLFNKVEVRVVLLFDLLASKVNTRDGGSNIV